MLIGGVLALVMDFREVMLTSPPELAPPPLRSVRKSNNDCWTFVHFWRGGGGSVGPLLGQSPPPPQKGAKLVLPTLEEGGGPPYPDFVRN